MSHSARRVSKFVALMAFAVGVWLPSTASAQWLRSRSRSRPVRVVVPTTSPRVAGLAPSPMRGTFYPDPSPVMVLGNYEVGGGYSPLGTYGDTSATLIGPLSAFRSTAAPVATYQRGYDGNFRPEIGTGFSNPNFPTASPIVYPSRANVRNAPRRVSTPPQWDSGINWIDLN